MNWTAFWTSIRLAGATSLVLLFIGVPTAYWLAYSRRRWKFLVEAVVALPLVLPPTVLGFYVLVAVGTQSPVGRWYSSLVGHPLPFTFEGLVLASTLYSLPFAVQPLHSAFESLGRKELEAARTLGASALDAFFSVIVPLTAPGFITALVLSFAHTLGEFGVVLMVGGNIPGETRLISIAIYDHVESLNYAAAHALSLTLLGFAFFILLAMYVVNRRLLRHG